MNLQRAYQALLDAYEALDATDGEFYFDKCAEIMPGLLDLAEASGAAWPKRCSRCGGATTRWREDADDLPREENNHHDFSDLARPILRWTVDCETCDDIAQALAAAFSGNWNADYMARLCVEAAAVRATPCGHGKFVNAGERCADCEFAVRAYLRGLMRTVL